MNPLTPAQQAVLEYFRFRREAGMLPPTVEEVMIARGYRSKETAHHHIAALRRKGYLTQANGCPRQTRLVEDATPLALLCAAWDAADEATRQTFLRRVQPPAYRDVEDSYWE